MINSSTNLFAVIGNPIAHSLSPNIHNAIFKKLNLNSVYCAFNVQPNYISDFITSMRTLNIKGVNVTVPYKEILIDYLDESDSFVKDCGAVNTILNHDGIIKGYNTDGIGFLYVLEHVLNLNLSEKNIVILGAGGTAKSIGFSLLTTSISSLTLINRSLDKLERLKKSLTLKNSSIDISSVQLSDPLVYDVLNDTDIIINTTSLGMKSTDSLLLQHMDWVSDKKICLDVIYSPQETLFLKESRLRGALTLNGLSMLAAQAMYASNYFTEKSIDFDFIYSILNR